MNYKELFIEYEFLNPLKKEELYECLEKAHQGDMKARNKAINHNIKLVFNFVNKNYQNNTYDLEELIDVGLIGLIKAVDNFDITTNYKFSPYAYRCIQNEILMHLRKNNKHISNISFNEVFITNNRGDEINIEDTLCDENINIEFDYEIKDSFLEIRKLINTLPPKEKEIIFYHFGFYGKCYSQREIASILGISQPHISRLLPKILTKLKYKIEKNFMMESSDKTKEYKHYK